MQKLIINNFKQINHAEIEIRDFLLLIGPQASGKSTIAKLIYFFKILQQVYIDLFDTDNEVLTPEEYIRRLNLQLITKFQGFFSFTEIPSPHFNIIFYFSVEDRKYIQFNVQDHKVSMSYSAALHRPLLSITEKIISLQHQAKEMIGQNEANEMKIRGEFFSRVHNESVAIFDDKKYGLYIPAGRNITVSFSEQFQMLFFGQLSNSNQNMHIGGNEEEIIRDFMLHSKKLVDFFTNGNKNKLEEPFGKLILSLACKILKGSYSSQNGQERIQVNDRTSVSLGNASSGQQEAIRIIQDLIYIFCTESDTIRFIEEPESHIYPEAQEQLIELLTLVANHCHSQMIVTTHSPYVLSTFNNMLYYSKVLKAHPEKRNELEQHFLSETLNVANNEFLGINEENFNAYSLDTNREDYCQSIKDDKTKLIGENFFDFEADKLNDDFAFLYNLM